MTVIPERDLHNHNARIIERAMAGDSFTVTRDGVPVADVTPHEAQTGPSQVVPTATLGDFLTPTGVDVDGWLDDIRGSDEFMTDHINDARC